MRIEIIELYSRDLAVYELSEQSKMDEVRTRLAKKMHNGVTHYSTLFPLALLVNGGPAVAVAESILEWKAFQTFT